MIKLLLSSLFLFLTTIAFCQHETIIEGKISHANQKEARLIVYDHKKLTDSKNYKLYRSKIDSTGHFMIKTSTIKSFAPYATFAVYDKTFELFLSPSDSLYIEADYNNFNRSAKITGTGSEVNSFLLKTNNMFRTDKFETPEYIDTTDLSVIKQQRTNLLDAQLFFLKNNKEKYDLSESHFSLIDANYKFSCFNYLFELPAKKNLMKEGVIKEFDLPENNYYNFSEQLSENINNKDYLVLNSYYAFIQNYLKFQEFSLNEKFGNSHIDYNFPDKSLIFEKYNLCQKLFKGEVSENYLSKFIKRKIEKSKTEEYLLLYERFKKDYRNSQYLQFLKKQVEEANKVVEDLKVNHPYDLKLKTIDKGTITFREFLNKNNKKLIYLDIWATWCRPCIRSIPKSNALQDSLTNYDVEFVSICIDRQETFDKWKNLVEENKWKGEHYFYASNVFNNQFQKLLKIAQVPYYAIIDKEGKLVEINSLKPDQVQCVLKQLVKNINTK